jgi:acetyltransferase
MGDNQVGKARKLFQQAGIPVFSTPENAVKAVYYLVGYYQNRQLLLQTPEPLTEHQGADHAGARLILEGVLQEGRKSLKQLEAKAILRAFRIPVSQGVLVHSPNEALVAAESIGFPVVLKMSSIDIAHKTDAEGVMLGISNAQSVRSAFNLLLERVKRTRPEARIDGVVVEPMAATSTSRELLIGIRTDPVFGPVILFGAGGTMTELLRDCAIALPPLNEFLARNLISKTRIRQLLGTFRHLPPVNSDRIVSMLMRLSEMACELPWIRQLEINPLLVDEQQAVAVDVRMEIDYIKPAQERYAHIAIHPYPVYLISHWQLKDGTDIEIRPIRPEDAGIEKEFLDNLSAQSRYYRFMHTIKQISPEMLVRFTQIDYHRELALIAVIREQGKEQEIGVSRYVLNVDGDSCEFAVVVADRWQHTGIGYKLMENLIEAARLKGIARMEGVVLRNNEPMLKLARSMGFEVNPQGGDEEVVEIVKAL